METTQSQGFNKHGQGKASNYSQQMAKSHSSYKQQLLCAPVGFVDYGQKDRNICRQVSDIKCKLLCCQAAAKERTESQYCKTKEEIKICERCFLCRSIVFCLHVTNVHTVAQNLPVGARLNQFWGNFATLGPSSKVIRILEEGHTFPFRNLPTSTRCPVIINGYVNPIRHSYPMEALHALFQKIAVVQNIDITEICPSSEISEIRNFFLSPYPRVFK